MRLSTSVALTQTKLSIYISKIMCNLDFLLMNLLIDWGCKNSLIKKEEKYLNLTLMCILSKKKVYTLANDKKLPYSCIYTDL